MNIVEERCSLRRYRDCFLSYRCSPIDRGNCRAVRTRLQCLNSNNFNEYSKLGTSAIRLIWWISPLETMALLRSGEGGHIPAYENERLDNGLGQKVSAEDRARIWQWMIRADLKDLGGEHIGCCWRSAVRR